MRVTPSLSLCLLVANLAFAAGPSGPATFRPVKFPGKPDARSRTGAPLQLNALYRYPPAAAGGEGWGLSSFKGERRARVVAAVLEYPPASSSFEGVPLADEDGTTFTRVGVIFVDAREQELGLQNAVQDPGPVRQLHFFDVPEEVQQVQLTSGKRSLPAMRIAPTGTAYQVKVESTFTVKAAGWLKAKPGGSARRFATVLELSHHHRNYNGQDLELSDSKHAKDTRYVITVPVRLVELDEQLRPHALPTTPAIVPRRLMLVVWEPDPAWTTPDWLAGTTLPALEDLDARLPAETVRRLDEKR